MLKISKKIGTDDVIYLILKVVKQYIKRFNYYCMHGDNYSSFRTMTD